MNYYPDSHPEIRTHMVSVTGPDGAVRQYMPRDSWEKMAEERDQLRRVLALVSAWRIGTGTRDRQLDRLLESAGETYGTARAIHNLIASLRAERAGAAG